MKKYRIVKTKRETFPFTIEKKCLWFWVYENCFDTFQKAENEIKKLKEENAEPDREIISYY